MDICVISFTKKGLLLSDQLANIWSGEPLIIYTKYSAAWDAETVHPVTLVEDTIEKWAKDRMEENQILLFIGACGIAVRAIAPNLTDKLHDSPVLVMDETGAYVIPILSGHMGGANEIAMRIANAIGAVPVITTATDLEHKFAVDLFAKRNGLFIVNKDGIAKVSSKVLEDKQITVSVEAGHLSKCSRLPDGVHIIEYPPKQHADIVITTKKDHFDSDILLKPKEYVIGMGCKRGKEADEIEEFITRIMKETGIAAEQILALASIDRKKDEKGLLFWSRKYHVPFITYTAEQLKEMEGEFHASAFVMEKAGVDNVCERAALKACKDTGKIIYEKHAENGMTIAIAKREWRITFDE
ncbi:MAG: cobalamin biosynthesis protein [Lachnospiraceae bacterium]|nr:cobalamin biosynthesis protein [Lachnospiraceae bacterium]